MEERHKALLADSRRDEGGVCFEATGIDYLYLDEAQAYKNLAVTSRITGIRTDGSKRAEDMAMKVDWLRKRRGQRVATFATATPIANSIAEMYVMQRYLAPDALAGAGVEHFDGWAANFGRTVTSLELAPEISQPPTTWAELVADGKKLTTGGRYGISIEGASTSEAAHWAFLLGEQYGNPLYAHGKWDFATPAEAKAVSIYVNMVGSEHIANPSDAQNNSNVAESNFANNKAAMLIWQNPMSTLQQLGMSPSAYGSVPIPTPSPIPANGRPIETFPAGINLAIPSSTRHKAAALALVKYMTSPSVQEAVNQTYGTFPPVLAAQQSPTFETPAYRSLESAYNDHAAPLPQVASESTMETDLGGAINKLIAQAATGTNLTDGQILSALKSAQDQLDAAAGAS